MSEHGGRRRTDARPVPGAGEDRGRHGVRGRHVSWRRGVVYGAGAVLVGIGVTGMVANSATTHPLGWLIWFAGAAILHDAVLAPLVLAAAVLVGRLPEPWRRAVRTALVPAAAVTLVALPMVLGLGRRADVPSRLPLAYGTDLAAILTAVGLAGAALATVPGRSLMTAGRWRLAVCAGLLAASVGVAAIVVV